MLLVFLNIFLFAQNTDSTVNKHLQKTHQRQEYYRQRAEIMGNSIELEQPMKAKEKEEGTYGVVREAPEEAFPDYSAPSKVYSPNPLESSAESVHRQKQLKVYEENLQREYTKQYIRNAEQDNVYIHINEDKIVDDYKQRPKPRPNSRTPSGYK
jgi:hypothetical protein